MVCLSICHNFAPFCPYYQTGISGVKYRQIGSHTLVRSVADPYGQNPDPDPTILKNPEPDLDADYFYCLLTLIVVRGGVAKYAMRRKIY